MEEKNKIKDEIEGKDNEIQHLSFQKTRLHQLVHQRKWGNHEPKIREWKIAEWSEFWKATQWKDDEILSRHESVEWEKSL